MIESTNEGAVPQQIGNYRILNLLGRGGFADVYLGEHIYLKTQAAIKLIRHRVDDSDLEEILNEARTIAKLEHPHIVRVFECGVEDDHPFLVMTYAPKGTLRQRFPKGTRLHPELVLSYVQQMASALQYAHNQKLIHRDIKPENMLIGQEDQLLLSDFGLVMVAHTSRSQASSDTAGTVTYMSPEQLQGRPRFASDQYALGIVTYEWICGSRPFNGSFAEVASQHVLAPVPSLLAQMPDLPPAVEQVVFKALAKDPAARFETTEGFAQALTRAYIDAFPNIRVSPESSQLLNNTSSFMRQSSSPSFQQGNPPSRLSNYATAPQFSQGMNAQFEGYDQRTAMAEPISGGNPQSFYQPAPHTSQGSFNAAPPMMQMSQQYMPTGTMLAPPTSTPPARHGLTPPMIAILVVALLILVGGSLAIGYSLLSNHNRHDPNNATPGTTGTFIPSGSNTPTPTTNVTVVATNTPTATSTAASNGATPGTTPTVGVTPSPTTPVQKPTQVATQPVSKPTANPTSSISPTSIPTAIPTVLATPTTSTPPAGG